MAVISDSEVTAFYVENLRQRDASGAIHQRCTAGCTAGKAIYQERYIRDVPQDVPQARRYIRDVPQATN